MAAIAPARRPDLLELRFDLMGGAALEPDGARHLVERSILPVIATCRPAWEGGAYEGEEEVRRRILEAALAAGAELVDVELEAPFAPEMARRYPDAIILSHHRSDHGAAGLEEVVARLIEARPTIAKLVVRASRADHGVPLLEAARAFQDAGVASACFCLGEAGRASRLLAGASGGALVYATAPGVDATAPGQWDVATIKQELRCHRWVAGQALLGVIGDPIDQSLSPTIFNAAFEADGRAAAYLPVPGARAEAALALAEAAGVMGLSVTMPFKGAAARACVRLSDQAARMGAVNTLVRQSDGWHGDNTDGAAVVDALEQVAGVAGRRCAVIGAGGAGRAAAVALSGSGVSVTLVNRTQARARRVAGQIGVGHGGLETLRETPFDIVINATPVGMNRTVETPVPTVWLKGTELVLDMVYRPLETAFLTGAAERGCRTVSGLEMFLCQAARQHRGWFGQAAPLLTMRQAAMRKLRGAAAGR